MVCGWSSCSNFGDIYLNSIQLIATEDQGPGLTAVGSDNLWYQSSHWVWNPPGDPWSLALSGSDPSGVCQMWAVLNGVQINSPAQTPDTAVWQQCPDWTWPATVDTTDYVPSSGRLALTLAGTNAAGVDQCAVGDAGRRQPARAAQRVRTEHGVDDGRDAVRHRNAPAAVRAAWRSAARSTAARSDGRTEARSRCRWRGRGTMSSPARLTTAPSTRRASTPTPPRVAGRSISGSPRSARSASQRSPTRSSAPASAQQVTVPAHWVTVRRHHKLVRVRKPAHTKTVTVERCHARIVWRRETVLGKGASARQARLGQANEARSSSAHPPHRDQDQDTGRVRPRDDRERLAGNRQRQRARRCAGADLDRARTTDKARSPPPPRPRLLPTARGAPNSAPGPHDSSKPSTAAAPACCRRPRHPSS